MEEYECPECMTYFKVGTTVEDMLCPHCAVKLHIKRDCDGVAVKAETSSIIHEPRDRQEGDEE